MLLLTKNTIYLFFTTFLSPPQSQHLYIFIQVPYPSHGGESTTKWCPETMPESTPPESGVHMLPPTRLGCGCGCGATKKNGGCLKLPAFFVFGCENTKMQATCVGGAINATSQLRSENNKRTRTKSQAPRGRRKRLVSRAAGMHHEHTVARQNLNNGVKKTRVSSCCASSVEKHGPEEGDITTTFSKSTHHTKSHTPHRRRNQPVSHAAGIYHIS